MLRRAGRAAIFTLTASVLAIVASAVQAGAPLTLMAWDAAAVQRARLGAIRRLADPGCSAIFAAFADADGRGLERNLTERAESAEAYIENLSFVDGSAQRACQSPTIALLTAPGLSRVYVCKSFSAFQLRQPRVAESLIIHEALHTLGLREDPPSSIEITQRIEALCH